MTSKWGFVRSVDFLSYRQKANLSFCDAQMTLVGHSYEAHLHNSKCFEDDIRWSQRFSYVLGRFHYILSVLRLFTQKKHLKVPEFCRSDFGYLWLFFKSAGTFCTTSGGPVCSPEKSGSLINWHIWLIIKTHQTNLMTPWDPQNPLGPPRTPPRPPLDPLTSPLTPLDP